jgi:poly(hydroxyalkanoate) depolymerase family esterase
MRTLSDTLARLAALRGGLAPPAAEGDRLRDLSAFGSNPGSLRARYYVPQTLKDGDALVVVLHGCTQDAAGYDRGSGWSQLADQHGFALLFPEQKRANNAHLCFNWFSGDDTRRGSGEALSIHQMITTMIATHPIDPARIFVTGLSAGGAMTSVMLAAYPDLFSGGAIIAGLPYGTAHSVPEAFDRMRAHGGPASASLAALVTSASNHRGPWPTISVWQGDSDRTVSPANAMMIVEQWRTLHGAPETPRLTETISGHSHQIWRGADGRDVIEYFKIAGLGHGTPLSTFGPNACGVAGPHMLEAGISSTSHIAAFWGLSNAHEPTSTLPSVHDERGRVSAQAAAPPHRPSGPQFDGLARSNHAVTKTIEDALRAAGLLR